MWDGIDPEASDRAFADLASRPIPVTPPSVSGWSKVGAFLAAPVLGAATAVNETARVANTAMGYLDTVPSVQRHDGPVEAERMRAQAKTREQSHAFDEALRSGAEYWKPDPVTATTASNVLFGASRVLTKVAGYALMGGGLPATAALTGIDEGATTTQQLQDRGVDPATALKVGATHGLVTAATVALPVIGRTALETAALVAAGGPGSYMAEQAISKHVLESAHYPDIAAEFDPFDKTGLAISTLIPGTIGVAAHLIRARNARATVSPETVDAAHVSLNNATVTDAALVRPDDVPGMQAHHDSFVAAREAMEAGEPVNVSPSVHVDVAHANEVLARFSERNKSAKEATPSEAHDFTPNGNAEVARMVEAMHRGVDDVASGRSTSADLLARADTAPEHALSAALIDRPELYDPLLSHLETAPPGMTTTEAAATALAHAHEVTGGLTEPILQPLHTDPDIARAMQIANERPDLQMRLGTEADAATLPARDYLEHVSSEAQRDRVESRAYLAAVNCFLARGE